MNLPIIDHETAILARLVGYDFPTLNHWERGIDDAGWGMYSSGSKLRNSELTPLYHSEEGVCGEFSAPTQASLEYWLRDKYNIYIDIVTDQTTSPKFQVSVTIYRNGWKEIRTPFLYRNHEEAKEEALEIALNYLKDELGKTQTEGV